MVNMLANPLVRVVGESHLMTAISLLGVPKRLGGLDGSSSKGSRSKSLFWLIAKDGEVLIDFWNGNA